MKGATSSRGSFFLHDSRWKRKHFPVLKWTLAALCDSFKEALGEGTATRIFARSQNWVNCRRVKRSERGKQTGENSHVQTLRVNERESFLLSSRDYPDSRCSCAWLHCIQQIALSRRPQVPSNCPEVLLLIICFVEELNWNVFDTREMPDRSLRAQL